MARSITKTPEGKVRRSSFTTTYQVFILALSLYVLVQLSVEVIVELPPSVLRVLSLVDLLICIVFLVDWIVFFFSAPDKWKYAKSHAVDLVSSIPFVQVLRPLRVFRIVRIVRAIRLFRGMKALVPILKYLTGSPLRSALAVYLAITGVVYFYCSLGLYNFEKGVNESIRGFGDVLWMAFITMTSVGYGDIYPKSGGGRIMAIVLVLTGMGLFSLVTAEVAAVLLRRLRGTEARK